MRDVFNPLERPIIMSHHQCQLAGSINVDPSLNVTRLRAALAPALEDLFLPETIDSDAFILVPGVLHVSLDLETAGGGYVNGEVNALVQALSGLSITAGCLEMTDFDASSTDAFSTPYFIGPTERDRLAARVHYGIEEAMPWLKTALGEEAGRQIREFITAFIPAGDPSELQHDTTAQGEHQEDHNTPEAPRG